MGHPLQFNKSIYTSKDGRHRYCVFIMTVFTRQLRIARLNNT